MAAVRSTHASRSSVAELATRKKLFRATAGLSLHEQQQIATQLQASGDAMLQTLQKVKKTTKKQKQATKENNHKYEWLHEHHHLKKLEETCAKELESMLLRMYNDACRDNPTPACPSVGKVTTTSGDNQPEIDSPQGQFGPGRSSAAYARELEELVQMEQAHRVAILKHAASERDQRLAMKQLLNSLRQRQQSNQSETAAATTAYMKTEAQNLIFDAVIGHQMIQATLEDEYKQAEQEYQAVYQAVLTDLRDNRRPDCNATGDPDRNLELIDTMLDSIFGPNTQNNGGFDDTILRLEVRDDFIRLRTELQDDLTSFERDFRLLAAQEDAAGSIEAAQSKTGGWAADDDERFLAVLKNFERAPGTLKKHEVLYKQVQAVLPHVDRVQVQRHVKFHQHLRFYQEKCRDRQKDYDRKYVALQNAAKDKIAAARREEEERLEKQQQLQRLREQCAGLQERVSEWRVTKEAEARIRAQQEELERMLAAQQKEEEDAKWRRRQEQQKQLLEEHRKGRLLDSLAEDQEAQAQQARLEEERATQSQINAERVQYRQELYEQKMQQERVEEERRAQIEAERAAKLEAIKQEAPYAEKLATIVADPERSRQETAAFRANVEAIEEGLPVQETGLFPSHGYDCDTLFKNARFKLGIALRDAGLHSTEYARQALANIRVSNAGAYRHHVPQPTQLW